MADLYGPRWAARSHRCRYTSSGQRRRCRRCWVRTCDHAHHLVRYPWWLGRLLDRVCLMPLCEGCHQSVHRWARRSPLPLWADTVLWVLAPVVVAGAVAWVVFAR